MYTLHNIQGSLKLSDEKNSEEYTFSCHVIPVIFLTWNSNDSTDVGKRLIFKRSCAFKRAKQQNFVREQSSTRVNK